MTSRISLGLAILAATSFSAQAATMSDVSFTIEATSDLGTASWTVDSREDLWSADIYNWKLAEDVELKSNSGDVIATIRKNNTSLRLIADPVVSLNFVVATNATTMFTVTSALLGFDPIPAAIASASAGITLTDNDGDGATLTGGYVGNTKSYLAQYNGAIPGGTTFTNLVDNISVGAFGTSTMNEAVGFTSIGGPVSSMQTQFSFTLGGGGSVAGTSVFVVNPIPEPTTIIQVFAVVGMIAISRRRNA